MNKTHGNSKYSNILTKNFLIQEYIKNKKSCNKIAKEINCKFETIRRYLIKFDIPRRATTCGFKNKKGQNHPAYIDGRTNKKYYCIDCGKEIRSIYAIRCKSCTGKTRFLDNKIKEKFLKASLKGKEKSPNKPEKLLNKLLQNLLPKEYSFVGNGKIFIAGFVPDFINCNGQKKIIELFGDYWHNRKNAKERDKIRLKTYKKYGYKTLIIWEHELKDLDKVKGKILKFNS